MSSNQLPRTTLDVPFDRNLVFTRLNASFSLPFPPFLVNQCLDRPVFIVTYCRLILDQEISCSTLVTYAALFDSSLIPSVARSLPEG